MKQIRHPVYGDCYELTHPRDIAFSAIAQEALVGNTIMPSGAKTPPHTLVIREHYLVNDRLLKDMAESQQVTVP